MLNHRIVRLAVVLAAFCLLGACAERNDISDVSIRAHPPEWMESGDADFHGSFVAAKATAFCVSCHGVDLRGDGSAPSCYECHDGPGGHPEDWIVPASADFHGDAVAATGTTPCIRCHGVQLRGGWAEVSCYNVCHDGPGGHPEDWLNTVSPDFHGDYVGQNGFDECTVCHGVDLRGGTAGISCYNLCHDGPSGHPVGWLDAESADFHAEDVRANGTHRCLDCHGTDLMGGWSEVSCFNVCHASPSGHPDGWLDDNSNEFHGDQVRTDGTAACQACHGADLLGGGSGVSCANACHDGPGGHPVGWTSEGSGDFHGDEVGASGYDGCRDCHGEDLRGDWTSVSCYNACHDTPSGHPSDWLSEASVDFHGSLVASDGTGSCEPCHGADLLGGSSEISCTSACHDGPGGHPSGWPDDGNSDFHGIFVAANSYESCKQCHGDNFRGGWSSVSCYSSCHPGPSGHPGSWIIEGSADFHGDVVEDEGWEQCMPCHGPTLQGGWSGLGCGVFCHA